VGKRIAYWYLRHLGHIFIARNYMPEHAKGERDLIGFDRDTVALIELSITREYTKLLFAPRIYFLREIHIKECPLRFDVGQR
jgi:hypothetical protein